MTTETLTKTEWLKRCADQFEAETDVIRENAESWARDCWDRLMSQEVESEAELLAEWKPEYAANLTLDSWADSGAEPEAA